MGAVPTALVTALVLPASTAVDWVLDLATGLGEACTHWRAGAVGGDLSSGDVLTVAITAHGDLHGHHPVLRSTARPGSCTATTRCCAAPPDPGPRSPTPGCSDAPPPAGRCSPPVSRRRQHPVSPRRWPPSADPGPRWLPGPSPQRAGPLR